MCRKRLENLKPSVASLFLLAPLFPFVSVSSGFSRLIPKSQTICRPTTSTVLVPEQHRVLRNTYWLLALSLVPTAIGAGVGMNLDLSFMRSNPVISLVAVLAIFYGWIVVIERNRHSVLGLGLLLGFTAFMGLLLGPLLKAALGLANGGQLVMLASGMTAATFFGLAAVATTSRRDFSGLGSFLMVGVIVAMVAVVANVFLASPALHLVLCGVFVILSSMLILYQLSAIVRGGETNYVSATLTLYISIYNLFSSLLQLLMAFTGQRE
ncbi:MAG: Bax inhibitor-1/YccA family protein [Burkholderiales bacterium]|nr:Bax inhibitor-1/YccA family protein [Burkholderiales bacterium]